MVPLVMGAFDRPERYHIPVVDDLIDMAGHVLMIQIVDFLPGHTPAISFTA